MNNYVIKTAQELIEQVKNTDSELILKKAKTINDSLLIILKQEDIDLRVQTLTARQERTQTLNDYNKVQQSKLH